MGGALLALACACLFLGLGWAFRRQYAPPLMMLGDEHQDGAPPGVELKPPEEGWVQDTAHLLTSQGVNFYLKEPGTGVYETMRAWVG